ncbi:MAG: YgjP-like metallopeptidase domain-containing protein [Rikenellaceae bacterium]
MQWQSRFQHSQLGDITLNRSARAKRISISVTPSGEVRLTLPIKGSEAEARKFLDSKVDWILAAKAKVAARPTIESSTLEEMQSYYIKAMSYLPDRTAALAKQFGFKYGCVSIRATRSKWGSCSGDNRISLTIFLMKLPRELIDFVIIHELCHTIHHNHSKEFHELVNRCTNGREKEFHNALKGYHCR